VGWMRAEGKELRALRSSKVRFSDIGLAFDLPLPLSHALRPSGDIDLLDAGKVSLGPAWRARILWEFF